MALVAPGNRFPAITLRDEKGAGAAPPAGETLIGFFKTTCPTCTLAWPYFDRIGKLASETDLSVLAVSQDDPTATDSFYQRLDIAPKTLFDREPWPASQALGLTNVPTFVRVGSDGRVRDVLVGFAKDKMSHFAQDAAARAGLPAAALFEPGDGVPPIKPG